MTDSVQAQFQRHGDLLMAGRYADLSVYYETPLPIHFDTSMAIAGTKDALRDYFSNLHHALMARGITRISPQITAREVPRGNRFRVWLNWLNMTPGTNPSRSEAVYFCRKEQGLMQIEMIHYTVISMPEIETIRQGLLLTA